MSRFCFKCERDKAYRDDPEGGAPGCPIMGRALGFSIGDPNYPKEWVRDVGAEWGLIGAPGARCTAFVREGQELPYRCTETKDLFG